MRMLQDLEAPDVLGRRNVWTSAEIDELADTEDAGELSVGDLLLDELYFELVVCEQVEGLLLR